MHCTVPVHTYVYEMHPRDLDHPQFEWQFQRHSTTRCTTTWSRCSSARRRMRAACMMQPQEPTDEKQDIQVLNPE